MARTPDLFMGLLMCSCMKVQDSIANGVESSIPYIPLLCGCQVFYLGQTVLLSACGWYFIHSRLLAETLRVRAVRAR